MKIHILYVLMNMINEYLKIQFGKAKLLRSTYLCSILFKSSLLNYLILNKQNK